MANDGYTGQESAQDIAKPRSAWEGTFWEKAYLAALHRVDAGEAAREASLALVELRKMLGPDFILACVCTCPEAYRGTHIPPCQFTESKS